MGNRQSSTSKEIAFIELSCSLVTIPAPLDGDTNEAFAPQPDSNMPLVS